MPAVAQGRDSGKMNSNKKKKRKRVSHFWRRVRDLGIKVGGEKGDNELPSGELNDVKTVDVY